MTAANCPKMIAAKAMPPSNMSIVLSFEVLRLEGLVARACLGDAQVGLRPGFEPRHAARRVRVPIEFEEAESEGRDGCGSRRGEPHRLRRRRADDRGDGRRL